MSNFFETVKLIAETITAVSAAIILFIHLLKLLPERVKSFFIKTLPVFIKGVKTDCGKKVRFFKAICIQKEQQGTFARIVSSVSPDFGTEEILVLNKDELINFIDNTKLFLHVQKRK